MALDDDTSDVSEHAVDVMEDRFIRPRGFEDLSMDDIMSFHRPTPTRNNNRSDTRLAVMRPHFRQFNTPEDLIKHVAKYNQRSAQKKIIANARRAFATDPQSTGLDMEKVARHADFAQKHGLIALLRHVISERSSQMVQPIDVETMVPKPTASSGTSQPPYPTAATLAVMGEVHKGIKLRIDQDSLVNVHPPSRDPGFNLAAERSIRKQMDKNLTVVVTDEQFNPLCVNENLQQHNSNLFMVEKDRTDPQDAGRFIVDFSASGINSDESTRFLAEQDGKYRDANAVYICRLALEKRARHPHQPLFICKTDVKTCFNRIPMDPHSIPMTATRFYKDDVLMVALSTGASFGLNASNSTQKSLTEAMHAVLTRIDREDLDEESASVFLDDFFGFRTWEEIIQFFRTRMATTDQFEGLDAISNEKSEFGEILQLLGYLLDMIDMTISVSDTLLEKYFWTLFHILPMDIKRGSTISLQEAQRASSYLHIICIIVPSLSAYSKGLARAMHGSGTTIHISRDAMIDIDAHRDFARRLFYDARCLALPMQILTLRSIMVGESEEEFHQRQMSVAEYILFSDARGTSSHTQRWGDCWMVAPKGTTFDTQDDNIVDYGVGEWPAYYENKSITTVKKLNIAILEMISTLRGAFAFLYGWKAPERTSTDPLHIHIITDNEVSLYRLLKNKGTHPMIPHLLRIHARLQQDKNVIFTYGKIRSEDNRFTDSGSRGFQNAYGPTALRKCSHQAANPMLPPWWDGLQAVLRSMPATHSRTTRK